VNNDRRDFIIRDIGCIACHMMGYNTPAVEKHHHTSTGKHGSGKRKGEKFTVGLCPYHHRGKAAVGSSQALQWKEMVGPSYADDARVFRATFGTDAEMLAYQEKLIGEWQAATV
jgi:cytochrome c551/c552